MRMRVLRPSLGLLLLLLLSCVPMWAAAGDIPPFTPNVVDPDGLLDAADTERVNADLQRIRDNSHIWGAVYLLRSLDGEAIENVAVQAFEAWALGAGGVDNGLLLVLAIDDRRSRFEVGYGLEGAIPDVVALHALDDYLAPQMRAGDTAAAIIDAFGFLDRVVAQDPDAIAELADADPAAPEDWRRGLVAWVVLLVAIWLTPPLRNCWVASRRARLARQAPELSLDAESVTGQGGAPAPWRGSWFIQGFLSINPGIFVVILSAVFVEAFWILLVLPLLIMGLILWGAGYRYASPERYRRYLDGLAKQRARLIEKGHLEERSPGVYAFTPAYHASQRSSTSSSSRSSSSSSSSGGGRSGGGGASSGW